ncbi:DNA mismatch repair protein PMS2 [Cladophialophora yegresii CBS 114405]|uniref:DNA mismatch repair protein PMS1 n=1 Tax=Cladophialophora yegresii CBS 114405 TaxID=1182544 RepID=W9W741_9EURO|nr:DNA mismatch repair protein PMS2 [Cladophialophora yegresii CBS 114405]EXJ63897.1 DNA mismatch repair protein PMS2 [Cladophialophora yegresii CBS 114405]
MATIKAIEAKSVHQIQSGQVIVDLCSVVKELVENSLDAGATALEVRFKNNGLDAIEVQDNGSGIHPANYENVALKHFTSKLSSYDDLSSLHTFGFRGEALSSLCALSKFSLVTAQVDEAPKGKRLEFDTLGRLRSTTIVAAQKGTTAAVENLFESLPVRRKELSKNIKREYGKVLGLLHAYACIGVNVKFTVKNTMPKSKSVSVFSTKGNATTRENIANVYGTKTLSALVPLDLELEYQSTLTQMARKEKHTSIRVKGHISKPIFGEGRQTPDRQMFFVNGRPCGLPQIAKAINEVYKAFNVSQSPFIFADLQMDTDAYDVNVSPDKRTILIHDSVSLTENLKTALNDMFDQQEQTVPQSQLSTTKLPAFRKPNFQRQTTSDSPDATSRRTSLSDITELRDDGQDEDEEELVQPRFKDSLFRDHFQNLASTREELVPIEKRQTNTRNAQEKRAEKIAQQIAEHEAQRMEEYDDVREIDIPSQQTATDEEGEEEPSQDNPTKIHAQDFNARMAEAQSTSRSQPNPRVGLPQQSPEMATVPQPKNSEAKGVVVNAFDRMRPKRVPTEVATVTVGDQTFTTILGSQPPRSQGVGRSPDTVADGGRGRKCAKSPGTRQFSQQLRRFGVGGPETADEQEAEDEEADVESEAQESAAGENEESEADDEIDADMASPHGDDGIDERATPLQDGDNRGDDDYIDEEEKKKAEDAKVEELIRAAEASSALPSKENLKRATKALAGGLTRDATTNLLATVNLSISSLASQVRDYGDIVNGKTTLKPRADGCEAGLAQDIEARLSLTVSKPDFARMRIVGQFNLGFILAVRPARSNVGENDQSMQDELFIIDQHASDEKYNFERLQAETVVGNQRLVRPVRLDLTAVEEEIVFENNSALEKNGFLVEIDTSGESMVGQRCSLVSLPLSKEVVFGIRDLEELIQLLAESTSFGEAGVPRPSKVRKMFAMRACRSSIMIGKTLSTKQMQKVVAQMGTIDKPWNCPHGRPTMRHVCTLSTLQSWREGVEQHEEDHVGLREALHKYVEID